MASSAGAAADASSARLRLLSFGTKPVLFLFFFSPSQQGAVRFIRQHSVTGGQPPPPSPARPRHGSVSGFCELIAGEVSIRNVWLHATIIWPDFRPLVNHV